MALLSTNRIAWTYTADDGTTYRVAAQKALTDQNKLGGAAWNGTDPPRPGNWKMRRISLSDASGRSRVVPVYETGAAICTAGETLTVNYEGDSHALSSSGNPIPQEHLRESVVKQST